MQLYSVKVKKHGEPKTRKKKKKTTVTIKEKDPEEDSPQTRGNDRNTNP